MKQTFTVDNPTNWDLPVSDSLIKEWSSVLKEAIYQDSYTFQDQLQALELFKSQD